MTARRVTTSDIARSLGISRATVGYVLNDTPGQTISEATRRRVLAEAERLGYRPNAAATALARGSSRVVLFLLPDWPVGHTLREYLEEATSVLDGAGYSLVTAMSRTSGQSRPLWETLDPDFVVPVAPLTDAELAAFRRPGAPRVLAGGEQVPEQLPATQAGSTLQVRHLHDLGHTRLAFAYPADPRVAGLASARAAAVRAQAAKLGLRVTGERMISDTDDSAGSAVHDWLATGVTGVVAYNDNTAAAVVGAAIHAGVAVPDRLAVVGHDDSPLARLFLPALTSVRTDAAAMGRRTAQAVLHSLGVREEPPAPVAINATVVRRATT